MAIMAMLTLVSMPTFSGYLKGARLREGARQIASALRQARVLAITKRVKCATSLYFQDSTATTFFNAVSIYENDMLSHKCLPKTISLKDGDGNEGSNGDVADAQIHFTPRGSASGITAFRVYDMGGDFREIKLFLPTGMVKVGAVNEDLL